jgi:hypothetical protein
MINENSESTNTGGAVVLVAATSGTLLAANANRVRAIISNPTSATLYVRKSALACSATVFDIAIPAGGVFTSDPGEWTGGYTGYSVAGGTVGASEST